MGIIIRPIDSDGKFIMEDQIELSLDEMRDTWDAHDDAGYDNDYVSFWNERRAEFEENALYPVGGYEIASVHGEHDDVSTMFSMLPEKFRADIPGMLRALDIASEESCERLVELVWQVKYGESLEDACDSAMSDDALNWNEGTATEAARSDNEGDVAEHLVDYVDWGAYASDHDYIEVEFGDITFARSA